MSFEALILRSDGRLEPACFGALEVLSLSWNALGGAQSARVQVRENRLGLEGWQGLLGRGLEIFNQSGQAVWWGYLEGFSQAGAGARLSSSLAGLSNRVAVAYTSLTPGSAYGEALQTPWAEDTLSQALYGVHERLLPQGMLADESALRIRDLALRQAAFPRLEAVQKEGTGEEELVLTCRGWLSSLAWRVWQGQAGLLGHAAAQNGIQALGDAPARAMLAQSFSTPVGQDLVSVSLRVRREGSPSDALRVELREDAGGQPGSTVLASLDLPVGALPTESYAWQQAAFPQPASLSQGAVYWLTLSRTGAPEGGAYYLLGVDEALGYTGGRLRLFDQGSLSWLRRNPEAHLLFKLGSMQATEDQICAVALSGGQFLNAVSFETVTGLSVPPYQPEANTCLQAFTRLVELGTAELRPLLASVSRERALRVYAQPGPETAAWQMDPSGRLRAPNGKPPLEGVLPCGEWVRSEAGVPFFVRQAELDVESGRVWLRT